MGLVAITPKFLADDSYSIIFSFDSAGKSYTGVLVPWTIHKIDFTQTGGKITGTINYFQDRSRWVESLKYAARNSKTVQIAFNPTSTTWEDLNKRIWKDVHEILEVVDS